MEMSFYKLKEKKEKKNGNIFYIREKEYYYDDFVKTKTYALHFN